MQYEIRQDPVELRATYRLQLTPAFGFGAARDLIPYLRDLGISHLYLSPSFQAREGSTHGYDVIDPGRLSDALGGREAFDELAAAAAAAGLGIVLDVVPNHMAADEHNRYWADPELRARFFDIDPVSGRHRRFFDVDDLAGVRQEDPEVFTATMGLALSLCRDGLVDGLRVDHPDGLANPREYLQRLRDGGASHIWVEKILADGEQLRDWPVTGTVGYEFLNDVAGLFVDPNGCDALTALWRSISGDARAFAAFAADAKLEQATGTFRPELERLGRTLPDGTVELDRLADALASLDVYRTYVEPGTGHGADRPDPVDCAAIADAESGGDGLPAMAPEIARRLLLEAPAPAEFVTRFQQTTPAIMAKGVEDTAFYRYGRLLALCDVGGEPGRFGLDVERFHAGNATRAQRFPENLLTTMTHDAKRSADVRARIGMLASLPAETAAAWTRFADLTEPLRRDGAPDDVERYFIFQTLVGAWPIELERVQGYLEKAFREAKRNTSWVEQNAPWEASVKGFIEALYADPELFERPLSAYLTRVAELGRRSALAQLALKLTCPGVPDIYQGDELDYRALVDPDNRRPVDWNRRQTLLRTQRSSGTDPAREIGDLADVSTHDTDKLTLIATLLRLRAERPEPFAGDYVPLDAGPGACAFLRGGEILTLVTLPRTGLDHDPTLPAAPSLAGRWRDVLTGAERELGGHPEPLPPLLGVPAGEPGFAIHTRVRT